MGPGTAADPAALLRAGLLDGVGVLLAGAAEHGDPAGLAGSSTLAGLGARLAVCDLDPSAASSLDEAAAEEEQIEAAAKDALAGLGGRAEMLVVDAASLFLAAGGGREGLMWSMQASWAVTRAVANAAFLPDSGGTGGQIVLLAPAVPGRSGAAAGSIGEGGSADEGWHAGAAVAGLENLARTLATEWARYGVTTIAVAPGSATAPGELETVLAYLASTAGSYFSGCLIDLRGTGAG